MFFVIKEQLLYIIYISFIDNLDFLITNQFISKIGKILEKMGQIPLEWGADNAIIYNISKIKPVLFSKAYQQKCVKLLKIRWMINEKTVYFKKQFIY